MSSLLTEYCNRHRCAQYVLPTNDGMCFFNDHKRPAFVCLTSTYPRSYSTCMQCAQNNSVIVEMFGPSREESFSFSGHSHVSPDTDISALVKDFSPVSLKSNDEIERWLWQFFIFHNRLRYSRVWKTWSDEQETTSEPLRTHEQMAHCAIKYPRYFNIYYTMYLTFTVGRKYLLFE